MRARRRSQVLISHVVPSAIHGVGEAVAASGTSPPGQQLSVPGLDGYIFTHCEGRLTVDQRRAYERDGFVIIKRLIPETDLTKYREHFARLCSGETEFAKGVQVVRDLGAIRRGGGAQATPATLQTINKVQNLESDAILYSYARHPELLRLLPAFTGSSGAKVVPFSSMVVNKPPDAGLGTSRHPLHQDLWFMPIRPASRIVAAWTALQPCNRTNGALFAVPGTHREPLLRHVKPCDGPVNAGFVGIQGRSEEAEVDKAGVVWLDMEPGDVAFFHPLLHHGSGHNRSSTTRQAISMHFVGTDCVFFDPLSDGIQRERGEHVAATSGWQYSGGGAMDMVQMYKIRLRGEGAHNRDPVFGTEGVHENAV